MKYTIFYFSGTGNSKWAVENLDKLLLKQGHTSTLCSIEKVNWNDIFLDKIQDIDYIGFAYPIYLQNMPRIMKNFIHKLTDLLIEKQIIIKYAFFINTFGYTNAYGVFKAMRLLQGTGISTVGYVNLKLTDNTKSNITTDPVTGEAMPVRIKEHAITKLATFIERIDHQKRYLNGINPSIIIGRVLSKFFSSLLKENYKNMKVEMSKCTQCMKCVENCPTKCIEFKDNAFSFSNHCESCMRCIYYCPAHAISNEMKK